MGAPSISTPVKERMGGRGLREKFEEAGFKVSRFQSFRVSTTEQCSTWELGLSTRKAPLLEQKTREKWRTHLMKR
jgi:hypothetical protein